MTEQKESFNPLDEGYVPPPWGQPARVVHFPEKVFPFSISEQALDPSKEPLSETETPALDLEQSLAQRVRGTLFTLLNSFQKPF